MIREAWMIGSLDFGAAAVRTGYTILALATVDELSRIVRDVSKEFQKIEAEALRKDFASIVAESLEEGACGRRRGEGA